jgi:hypothetical protein
MFSRNTTIHRQSHQSKVEVLMATWIQLPLYVTHNPGLSFAISFGGVPNWVLILHHTFNLCQYHPPFLFTLNASEPAIVWQPEDIHSVADMSFTSKITEVSPLQMLMQVLS